MPYISSTEVTAKRKEIRNAFPGWKISVTREHHSSIRVEVLEAPIQMTEKDYEQVNTFYISSHYAAKPEVKDALLKLYQIAASGVRELVNDGDYGSVPTFYTWINVGAWDKPFKFICGAAAFKVRKLKTS